MVGTDINKESIKNANKNIETNNLQKLIQGNYFDNYIINWSYLDN